MTDKHDEQLDSLLKDYPMPQADAGFYDQALARATQRGIRRRRRRGILGGVGAAVAAGLSAWIVFAFLVTAPTQIPGVTVALAQPQTVNLMFSSEQPLDRATVTIILPDGIELDRFPGQREISWETSLVAGKNLLPLTILATADGEIQAQLKHNDRTRSFRLHIDVS